MDSIWDEDKENQNKLSGKTTTVENHMNQADLPDDDEDDGYRQVNVEHDGPAFIQTWI